MRAGSSESLILFGRPFFGVFVGHQCYFPFAFSPNFLARSAAAAGVRLSFAAIYSQGLPCSISDRRRISSSGVHRLSAGILFLHHQSLNVSISWPILGRGFLCSGFCCALVSGAPRFLLRLSCCYLAGCHGFAIRLGARRRISQFLKNGLHDSFLERPSCPWPVRSRQTVIFSPSARARPNGGSYNAGEFFCFVLFRTGPSG